MRLRSNSRAIPVAQNAPGPVNVGGVTGVDRINATSLGTGTTKTLLGGANMTLPDWARSIVAVRPVVNIDVPTVSESVIAKLVLESDDFNVGPYEVLASPVGACLGATVAPFAAKPEYYPVNCPVSGGQLKIYGQALVANTAAPIMSCAVVVSNQPPTGKQKYAKMGTLTGTGTVAATEVAGTSYNFTKSSRITELFGIVAPDTVEAADALSGYIRFSSTEFTHVTPAKLELTPSPGGLSTIFSSKIDGVSREPVSIPTNSGQVTIQDYLYMDVAPHAAGSFIGGLMFE